MSKTPVDVPWIVRVRQRSKLTYKVGAKNWYAWPGLTKAQRSEILNGRKSHKEPPMVDWNKYLPTAQIPNTGPKQYKEGEFWAVCVSQDRPYIFRVKGLSKGSKEYFDIQIVAGEVDVDFISCASTAAEHSARICSANTSEAFMPKPIDFLKRITTKEPVINVEVTKTVEVEAKLEGAEAVILRIIRKGEEHLKAGRKGQFSQVMVPMEDYLTLCKYFQVGEPPFDDVLVSTPIGVVGVYPVNPDGATFTD